LERIFPRTKRILPKNGILSDIHDAELMMVVVRAEMKRNQKRDTDNWAFQ
jgi:hypothetical protein